MFATERAPSPRIVEFASSIIAPTSSLLPAEVQSYVDALYHNICISVKVAEAGIPSSSYFDDVSLLDAHRLLLTLCSEHGVLPSSIILDHVRPNHSGVECGGGYADIMRGLYNGRCVAFKILRPWQDNRRRSSCREAAMWLMVDHPYILPLLGAYPSDDGTCMVMISPWCSNGNLEDYLASGNRKQERCRLLIEIAGALVHCHSRNIVHGDLHPKNILIDDDGHAQVADFGTSGFAETTTSNSPHGQGIPGYMAPEKYHSPRSHQKSNDVFSFASICFFVYTARPPFDLRAGGYAVADAVVRGVRPPRPDEDQCGGPGAGLPDGLWELMSHCWLQDPAERPSAMEVHRRLRVVFGQ